MSICSGLAVILNAKLLHAAVAGLPYCMLAMIVGFDIAASLQRVRDCSHSGNSLSFCDQKSNAGLRT